MLGRVSTVALTLDWWVPCAAVATGTARCYRIRAAPLRQDSGESGGAGAQIEWVPGHAGVPGNELTDSWAVDEARQGRRRREEKGNMHRNRTEKVSLAFLKARRKKEAVREWREEIIRRRRGSQAVRVPAEGEVPRIPIELRKAPEELASRFFQLVSGHAIIAPFAKENFGWTDSGLCWWCGSARQTGEHLFKECITWKEEIKELWKGKGEMSGHSETRVNVSSRMYKGRKGFLLMFRKWGDDESSDERKERTERYE